MNTKLLQYRRIGVLFCISVAIVFGVAGPWTPRIAAAQSAPILCKSPPTLPILDDTVAHRVTRELLAAGRIDTFGGKELEVAVKHKGRVIIHHGAPRPVAGYQFLQAHVETLPIYLNGAVGVRNVAQTDLEGILTKEFSSWSQLGGLDREIKVYGPSGSLAKKAWRFQLETAGMKVSKTVIDGGSYSDLARRVVKDPGALVVGLRSSVTGRDWLTKKTVRVDVQPEGTTVAERPLFCVPITVYMREGDPAAKALAITLFESFATRAERDGVPYPLGDRLRLLKK